MKTLIEIGHNSIVAKRELIKLLSSTKAEVLEKVAENLNVHYQYIVSENEKDIANGRANNLPDVMIERLTLNKESISQIAEGVSQVAKLEDPIGEVSEMKKRPNGLMIGKKRVPLGCVGIIYESRPNVTADAFSICFKTGNSTILRGGKEAIHSNKAIVKIIRDSIKEFGINPDVVQIIEDTSRETAVELMKLNKYVDVLIPRGGAGLINAVVNNSTVPVIETGVGNCHIYIHKDCELEKAINIVVNAKTQRPSVCNAAESVLIDKAVADKVVPLLCEALENKNVEIVGDEIVCEFYDKALEAKEQDWSEEYLDYKISIKIVKNIDEAIDHIDKYSSHHSEAIITKNYDAIQQFVEEVDSAAVYANASTRFTDGFEFGYGAEIGISTQKLHARGPMGIKELTSEKYIIYGNGQIRE
jgi:glutamate-5-semialdehyde dehydrogenase